MFFRTTLFLLFVIAVELTPLYANELHSDTGTRLISLAEKKFGILTKPEKKLFRAVANGKAADYSYKEDEKNRPANSPGWGPDRLLKANRIVWLCTSSEALELVDKRGILIKGAHILGNLDLASRSIPLRLYFKKCAFDGVIDFQNAHIKALVMSGSHTGPIIADLVEVDENIVLNNGFESFGGVSLVAATINGYLNCGGGKFHYLDLRHRKKGIALNAEQITVKKHVTFCEGFESHGQVCLTTARIGGQLNCQGGKFINKEGVSIAGHQIKVNEDVFLTRGFISEGEVVLLSAKIKGSLVCSGGHFLNKGRLALSAGGLQVGGSIALQEGFKALGQVNFINLIVNGIFNADGENSIIDNAGKKALVLDGMRVGGAVFLRNGFQVKGEVSIVGAKIEGQLSCDDGRFENKGKASIVADQMRIGSMLSLASGFRSEGLVRITNTYIAGQVSCNGGHFINKGAISIAAGEMTVNGSVHMAEGFVSEGEVRLLSANIGGQLDCHGGHFINSNGTALNAEQVRIDKNVHLSDKFIAKGKVSFIGARINGDFNFTRLASPETIILDLRAATIKRIVDDSQSWPKNGNLFLNGLVYEVIDPTEAVDFESRIDWLTRQPHIPFRPQPYEQLAKVLRTNGREDEAVQILILKNQNRARFTKLSWYQVIWYYGLGRIIGYGYYPWPLLFWGLGFILLGWIIFWIGKTTRIIMPIKDGDRQSLMEDSLNDPLFLPLLYSVDAFVPIVDLRHANCWLPDTQLSGSLRIGKRFSVPVNGKWMYRYLCWIHIPAGWVVVTLAVSALVGLIRT